MKKSLRKILAIVLCLSVFLTISPLAMAASTTSDDGYNFRGVYRVKYRQTLTVNIPKEVRAAEHYEIYIHNEDIAITTDISSKTINLVGYSWGSTVLSYDIYEVYEGIDVYGDTFEYYDYVDTYNYVVIVYDDEDAQLNGEVTDIYVNGVDTVCDQEGYLEYDWSTNGDVYVSTIVYYDGYGIDVFDDGYYYAYDRGEVNGIIYAIDTNGNIVSDTFTITARYTPWQWIKNVFSNIFNFLFGWIFGGFDF